MLPIRFSYSVLTLSVFLCGSSWAVSFDVNNLVTDDQSAHAAQITDPELVNAWGVSFGPTSPFWVSANGSGKSTLYVVNPLTQATTKVSLTVSIPGDGSVTGQVFNSNSASSFSGNNFLFVSEDGTVSGWRGALGTTAENVALASSANVYKGAAFASISGNSYLYAANFRAGMIDVFKGTSGAPTLPGSFTDPGLPAGYAPFNVQNLNGTLNVIHLHFMSVPFVELKLTGRDGANSKRIGFACNAERALHRDALQNDIV